MNNIDIQLNKKCRKFISDIEADFRYPIEVILIDKEFDVEYGFSKVVNGRPIIELNKKSGVNAEALIHEAYHLRLNLDGFKNPGFKFNNIVSSTEDNEFFISWVQQRLWDKILHYIFYPKMVNLGVDPYNSFTEEIKNVLKTGEIKNLNKASIKEALSFYYLQTFIEAGLNILDKLKSFYIEKYNDDAKIAINNGDKMIEILTSNDLNDIDDALNIFKNCFDVVMPVSLKFIGFNTIENNLNIPLFTFIRR